jgi:hypothetical protein
MITAIIFSIHFIFILIIYTKKWQEEGIGAAWMNAALIIILFSVGWALTGTISKLLMDQRGFGIYFDRDAFSLTMLTILEFFFYNFFFRTSATANDKEKQ